MAKKATQKKIEAPMENNPYDKALLASIVSATQSGGFLYVSALDAAEMVRLGLIEQNADYRNEHGQLATRSTPAGAIEASGPALVASTWGLPEHPGVQLPPGETELKAPKRFFEIDDDVPLPPLKRGGGAGRESIYPFDELQPGQSFHDPATAETTVDELARKFASSVASANRKYARETGEMEHVTEMAYQVGPDGKRVKIDGKYVKLGYRSVTKPKTVQERKFTLRRVGAEDKKGPGIRVFRLR